jgi:hypothetical protein
VNQFVHTYTGQAKLILSNCLNDYGVEGDLLGDLGPNRSLAHAMKNGQVIGSRNTEASVRSNPSTISTNQFTQDVDNAVLEQALGAIVRRAQGKQEAPCCSCDLRVVYHHQNL